MTKTSQDAQMLEHLRAPVDNFLANYRAQTVLHFPNPGNAGDSLLAAGTFQAFGRHGVKLEIVSLEDQVDGQIVFLGGGGNFVPFYKDIRSALEKFHGRASQIVLLPHTVRGHEDILCKLDETCTFFLRDRHSYDYVRATNPDIRAVLAHDMAFHLDVPSLMTDASLKERGEDLVLERLAQVGASPEIIRSKSCVDFLRLDIESKADTPLSDADISMLFGLGVAPDTAPQAAWCFLRAIGLAQSVVTDRLHVGIGAALLGIPCALRDNSYGKNAAVYLNSLQSFSNLRFVAG